MPTRFEYVCEQGFRGESGDAFKRLNEEWLAKKYGYALDWYRRHLIKDTSNGRVIVELVAGEERLLPTLGRALAEFLERLADGDNKRGDNGGCDS